MGVGWADQRAEQRLSQASAQPQAPPQPDVLRTRLSVALDGLLAAHQILATIEMAVDYGDIAPSSGQVEAKRPTDTLSNSVNGINDLVAALVMRLQKLSNKL